MRGRNGAQVLLGLFGADNDVLAERLQRGPMPLDEALQLFRDSGDLEKADLFSRRRKDYLTLYELAGAHDYFHGFMVPSTGYLDLFDLRLYSNGYMGKGSYSHMVRSY